MVQFSKASLYGIKAAIYLAKLKSGHFCLISKIAEEVDIPFHYLTKILQRMRKDGLVVSSKGANGGVYLAKSISEINLYQIINSIEGKNSKNKLYYKIDEQTEFLHASLKSVLSKIENYANSELAEQTLDKYVDL